MTTHTKKQTQNPWGAWSTLSWGIGLIALYLLVTGIIFFIGAGISVPDIANLAPEQMEVAIASQIQILSLNGDFNSLLYVIGFTLFLPLILLLSKVRKNYNMKKYLALDRLPSLKITAIFVGLMIAIGIIQTLLVEWLNIPYPQAMLDLQASTEHLWLAALAVVICAPIFEEVFFRGFLFKGWKLSKLGAIGTILITSILFTLIHGAQYDFAVLTMLFTFALLLGSARYISGSLYLPILLHFLNNLISVIQMQFFM